MGAFSTREVLLVSAIREILANKTKKYLELFGKKENKDFVFNDEFYLFVVREKIEFDGIKIDLLFIIHFVLRWVQIVVPLFTYTNLSDEERFKLFKLLLKLNHEIFDTEFEIYDEMDFAMITNEIHLDSFFYDAFEEEYNAIKVAVRVLIEEMVKLFGEEKVKEIFRAIPREKIDEIAKKIFERDKTLEERYIT